MVKKKDNLEDQPIDVVEKMKDSIVEEVRELEQRKQNLEAQIKTAQIRLEGDVKAADQIAVIKTQEREEKLNRLQAELYQLKDSLELKEMHLNERKEDVEKSEARIGMINEQRKQLEQDRNSFAVYKDAVMKDLNKAKITIAEAEHMKEEVEKEKEGFAARERVLKMKEEKLDQDYGVFEQQKREWEIFTKNEIKEATNV